MAHVGVVVLVRVLVGVLCTHVGPLLEVAQGLRMEFSLGYAPSEVVSPEVGAALVNISAICLRVAVCLSPNVVRGLVGVGLRRAWVRYAAACFDSSFQDSIGKVSVSGEKSVVSETLSFAVLGM